MASSGDKVNKYMTSGIAKTLKSNVCQIRYLKLAEKVSTMKIELGHGYGGNSVPQHLRVEVRQRYTA